MNHIALITDDGYAMPTAVCIQSIIDSKLSPEQYCVHVCTFGLSQENRELLESLKCHSVIVQIDMFDRNNCKHLLQNVEQKTHVTPTALIKFELPTYFYEIDRILYLDSDITVKKDLAYLFSLNLSGFYLAASFEYWVHYNNLRFDPKRLRVEQFYFNSGVMMLNLNEFRKNNVTEQLWDYKINHSKTKLMDQECLNSVCGKAVLPLSIVWNFNPIFLKAEHLKEINQVYKEDYCSISDMESSVCIVHYVGKSDKPWVYSTAKMRKYWQKSFEHLNTNIDLELIAYQLPKKGFFKKIKEIVYEHGFCNSLHYMIYFLSKKLKG